MLCSPYNLDEPQQQSNCAYSVLQVKFGSTRGVLDFQSPGSLDTSWVQVSSSSSSKCGAGEVFANALS